MFLTHGATRKNGIIFKNNYMNIKFFIAIYLILFYSEHTLIYADFLASTPEHVCKPTSSPIVPLPSDPFTQIRQRIIHENEFEFAILETSPRQDGFFWSFIVIKEKSKYIIYLKKINLEEILNKNVIDPSLVRSSKVLVKYKEIDEQSVKTLRETLKRHVIMSKYREKNANFIELDGTAYEVYAKGNSDDSYPMYAGKTIDGPTKCSYSCSTITSVLAHLILSEVDQEPTTPLNNLVNYLKHPEGQEDPFIKIAEPEPELDLPH